MAGDNRKYLSKIYSKATIIFTYFQREVDNIIKLHKYGVGVERLHSMPSKICKKIPPDDLFIGEPKFPYITETELLQTFCFCTKPPSISLHSYLVETFVILMSEHLKICFLDELKKFTLELEERKGNSYVKMYVGLRRKHYWLKFNKIDLMETLFPLKQYKPLYFKDKNYVIPAIKYDYEYDQSANLDMDENFSVQQLIWDSINKIDNLL